MNKLELKHIAPYLPYGLKAEILDFQSNYVGKQYDNIIGVHQWDKSGTLWSILTEGGAKPSLDRIKPILRPLSDLTELMPNNETSYVSYLWYGIISTNSDSFSKDEFYENCSLGSIEFLPIMVLNKLLEWHFDIYGLIEQGLAIDINTLNK